MPIKVTCTNCGGVLHAPDDAGGKRGRCPTCGNILPIPALAGAGGDLPEPPAPGGGPRPSFSDFSAGPQVAPPPAAAPDARNTARSSIPFSSTAGDPPAPPQRAKPPVDPAEPRRPADPFARKGTPGSRPTPAAPSETVVKGWRSARGGLGWVQAATFLLFVPLVLLPSYYTAMAVMQALAADGKAELIPYRNPGFLGLTGLSSDTEVPLLSVGVPLVLALLLHLFGRLGLAGAPKRAAVGGPAMLAALASMLAVCCVLLVVFPYVIQVMSGQEVFPTGSRLFVADGGTGLAQRVGLFVGVAAVVVGEFWFASAVGRVGSALSDGKPAARATRYLLWLGLVVIGLVGTGAVIPGPQFGLWAPGYEQRSVDSDNPQYAQPKLDPARKELTGGYTFTRPQVTDNPAFEVGRETNELVAAQWERHVGPQFDRADKFKGVVSPALFVLGGLFGWVMYLRMVGAARGAIGGWLDAHGGTA